MSELNYFILQDIVEIKDILKSNEPEDQDKKMEVPA